MVLTVDFLLRFAEVNALKSWVPIKNAAALLIASTSSCDGMQCAYLLSKTWGSAEQMIR